MTTVTPRDFRFALGQYATGVAVITALEEDRPIGLTVNSFASVSLDPPLVLWCIDKGSPLCAAFSNADHYAVHVLEESQQSVSRLFADDSADKFAGLDVRRGIHGLPLLDTHIALLQCEVVNRHEAGDHLILIGEVLDIQHQQGDPMLFFSGDYRVLQA
jgi:flavin reductase (DIM6/NTAB) family NADH-FMN oxidoreductase RutF